MNSAVSLGSFPRRREPITRDLTDTEYGSPPARGRRKPRADHPETVSLPIKAPRRHDLGRAAVAEVGPVRIAAEEIALAVRAVHVLEQVDIGDAELGGELGERPRH